MKTAVVILNWNGKGFLEKFLPGVVESVKGYDAEVVVADNASIDGSMEWVSQNFPELRQIRFRKNHGFTGGYNKAFEKIDCKYFLLLNSDIEVTDNWLYPLEEWMDLHEDCAACSPKLHSYQNRDMFEYAGAAGGFLDYFCFPFCRGRVMKMVEMDNGQYDDPKDVMWASGACLMVRSSVWKELGGLDGRFFAHMEEIDFCWRARTMGYRTCVVPRSMVYHVGGGTLPQDSPEKLYLNYRNNLLMMQNNYPRHEALSLLYELLNYNLDGYEVCADPINNCLEVFADSPRKMQALTIETCAKSGISQTKKMIRRRIFIDWLASIVYRMQGHKDYAKAVRRAHKDFKKLGKAPDLDAVAKYLTDDVKEMGRYARTSISFDFEGKQMQQVCKKGIYEGIIILEAKSERDNIFEYLRSRI